MDDRTLATATGIVERKHSPQVGPAFARTVRRSIALVLVTVIVSYVGTSEWLFLSRVRQSVLTRARLCSAGLTPGPGGDLASAAGRLRARYPGFLAVATLDASNKLASVYPDRREFRQAAAVTLRLAAGSGGCPPRRPSKTTSPTGGPRYSRRAGGSEKVDRPWAISVKTAGRGRVVWGTIVPLNGDSSPTARQVLILLAPELEAWHRVQGTIIFTIVAGLAVCVSAWLLIRWFDRRVAGPLQSLARPFEAGSRRLQSAPDVAAAPRVGPRRPRRPQVGDASAGDSLPTREPDGNEPSSRGPLTLKTGGWSEMERIAEHLRRFSRSAGESDARARRLELEAQSRLRYREARFDRQLRRARDKATTDPLTRLRNRSFLDEELLPLVERQLARRKDLAVAMLDLDNFKDHNDTQGHKAGDEVLRRVGELLLASIRPTDHAIRYGGDEFLLLLPDSNAQHAHQIAERILKLFAQYTAPLTNGTNLSMSVGVAALRDDPPDSTEKLLDRADTALYAAKRKGKNAVVTI